MPEMHNILRVALLAVLTIQPLQDGIDISAVAEGMEMFGAASVLYPAFRWEDERFVEVGADSEGQGLVFAGFDAAPNFRRARMLNRFLGLWHDSIIGSNNQHDNIRCLGTTGTHGCESCMPRCIEESDNSAFCLYLVCANMLCYSTGFAVGNLGCLDVIK